MGGEHVRFLLTRENLGHRMNYVGDKLAVKIILRDFIIYIYIYLFLIQRDGLQFLSFF